MSRILTHRGYSILKTLLNEEQTETMKESLTVSPKVNARYVGKEGVAQFKLYKESPLRWYVPRAWGLKHFGAADETVLSDGVALSLEAATFHGTPFPYQTNIIETFLNAGANGLICVPCGKGKTFMALNLAARLGKRFLIVVDKEFLMNQWKGEIQKNLPGVRVGILQSDTRQVGTEVIYEKGPTVADLKEMARKAGLRVGGTREELLTRLTEAGISTEAKSKEVVYDCTICMIQTICGQTYPDGFFASYGFTIFDECHHLGAQFFSRALQKVQTKHMLGLSATPVREDGLSKVFHWYLGTPVYWEKTREPDPHVEVEKVSIHVNDPVYNSIPLNWKKEPIMAKVLTNILGCELRNKEILTRILRFCEDSRRKVLVLSERIGHLQAIEELIVASNPAISISYYIGGMKEDERETGAAAAQVLLASYAMASEAMNIKTLNTVVLASPRKNVEQSTGRILRVRPEEREVNPVIVDIVDTHSMYQSMWKRRHAYYKKCQYKITGEAEAPPKPTTVEAGCLFLEE
jgi:superfamily II DNA or RNA helicase